MAEAFLNEICGDHFEAHSGGAEARNTQSAGDPSNARDRH
ncbi:MAG: hypothetical protein ACREFF_00480 [Candidatus Udaeobacter sp.]